MVIYFYYDDVFLRVLHSIDNPVIYHHTDLHTSMRNYRKIENSLSPVSFVAFMHDYNICYP